MPSDSAAVRNVTDSARKLARMLEGVELASKPAAALRALKRDLDKLDKSRQAGRENLVSRRAVMSAVYHLGGSRGPGRWPTAGRIAEFLKVPEPEVLEHLRALKRARMFTDRQRQGERVWMPWEES